MPPPSPMPMPIQLLDAAPEPLCRKPDSAPPGLMLRRVLVLGTAACLALFGTHEMAEVLDGPLLNVPAIALLVLFALLFAWIALAFVSGVVGFIVLVRSGGERLLARGSAEDLKSRTALLMPIHNEQPAAVFGAISAMRESLRKAGAAASFDIFVLSDTTDPDAWVAEEAHYLAISRTGQGGPDLFYRRRRDNAGRKVGNIAEWVTRHGGAYENFVVLDADSIMTAEALITLAATMDRQPGVGLIQTLPVSVGGRTVLARLQQFAGRVHGALVATGADWWQGSEGNYYGHNAIIRTRAFAEAAGLPRLPGRKPFGGDILSHDFIEAAMLRRADWAVHMVPGLAGSYEEGPPTLIDSAIRDRRWCQGNIQHTALLTTAGFHPISRLHLLTGIGAYLTAPLWLAFLVGGIILAVQAHLSTPSYFPSGHVLFPEWPVVDPVRAKWMFLGTMLMLIVPKLLAAIAFLVNAHDRQRSGGGARVLLGVMLEIVITGLLAPVTMLTQARQVVSILLGRDAGWSAQSRSSDRVSWREAASRYWGHTVIGVVLASGFLVAPALALWMSPVILGLVLAIPLVVLTGSAAAGYALRNARLMLIPEETAPPHELSLTDAARARLAAEQLGPGEAIAQLAADEVLLELHCHMLPKRRARGIQAIDLPLATGLAKLDAVDELPTLLALLDRREKAALLADGRSVLRLVRLARGRRPEAADADAGLACLVKELQPA
ncbi:glucans biosynthesis glucosyltransferase MdoH [Elioraea rosea]|uniref:glucans biosynthesis glucosyltransferase MdoH n=1 Tax=Elioraea rosea TaxID=2492390 RepID=UPI001EF74838|nr:glucans biosynthesis glucosyltransferase MdoH [Elioraea rosea]